jgi:hypothetical protein
MKKQKTESQWIRFPECKPKEVITAIVFNEKGFMCLGIVRAMYYPQCDVWHLYEPMRGESLALDVTHYLPIPTPPKVL